MIDNTGPIAVLLSVGMEYSDREVWTGLSWLRMGTGGGLL
jgi:hypothetical protein